MATPDLLMQKLARWNIFPHHGADFVLSEPELFFILGHHTRNGWIPDMIVGKSIRLALSCLQLVVVL